MKFADKYLPPLPDGEYTVCVTQSVATVSPHPKGGNEKAEGREEFSAKAEFDVISRAYTLLQEDVFSVYPARNQQGDFKGEVPFLVSGSRTLPWLYGDGRLPWVALIVVGEEDGDIEEQDIAIGRLLSTNGEKVYFPVSAMPRKFVEKKEDSCHILDLPLGLFREIMPKRAETEYLCHSQYTHLADTEEKVSCMDGFFSVIIGNRMVPEGQSVMHLVSVLGYPDYEGKEYEGYEKVRLVSLYRWGVCCEPGAGADFRSVMEKLDTGMFRGDKEDGTAGQGMCAKAHYTRSGERTGSLFHSPLVPYRPEELPQVMEPCFSADSVLIYDKEKGIFNVTYAAAWQLGRMAALDGDGLAQAVAGFRGRVLREWRKQSAERTAERMRVDYGRVCRKLAEMWGRKEDGA